ncbi:hypothetical protein ABI59_07935 [Acidobacteria bacterium Mor1]|nr:hypothetical protein ABI59_07935 [Acidobacteria bacterium Mor1]
MRNMTKAMTKATTQAPQRALTALLLVALIAPALVGCSGAGGTDGDDSSDGAASETTSYTVRGKVVGPSQEGKALKIEHEEIPDFMAAMTMDFPLEDPADAERFPPGSLIEFEYLNAGFDSRIRKIEMLPEGTALQLPSTAGNDRADGDGGASSDGDGDGDGEGH